MKSTPHQPGIVEKSITWFVATVIVFVHGIYTPWSIYHSFPTAESLMHLNNDSITESWHVAVTSWFLWTPRLGEFVSYFFNYKPFIFITIQHAICMLLLLISIYRISLGRFPDGRLKSWLLLLYATMLLLFLSPDAMWWIDAMNWIYPCILLFSFFVACEKFGKYDKMGAIPYTILLVNGICVSMSNEVFALCVFPSFMLILVMNHMCFKTKVSSWQNITLSLVLIVFSLVFILVTSTGLRVSVAGIDTKYAFISNLFSYKRWISVFLFFPHLTVMFAVIIGTYIYTMFVRKEHILNHNFFKLVLLAFIVYGVSIVLPGYPPHREYRVLQIFLICISVFCLNEVLKVNRGIVLFTLIFSFSIFIGFNQIKRQVNRVLFQRDVWNAMQQSVEHKVNKQGIATFTSDEIDNIFENCDKKSLGNNVFYSQLYLIRAPQPISGEFKHKYADHNFIENTDPFSSKSMRNKMLKTQNSDFLLNRCVAERLGVRGVVVYGDEVESPNGQNIIHD